MTSTIRIATEDDLPEVRRLLGDRSVAWNDMDLRSISTENGHRYALVLDDSSGGIAAAAVVTMDDRQATLELLAVEPRHRERGLEERMLGVAEALCDAFGCERLVVPHAA